MTAQELSIEKLAQTYVREKKLKLNGIDAQAMIEIFTDGFNASVKQSYTDEDMKSFGNYIRLNVASTLSFSDNPLRSLTTDDLLTKFKNKNK